MTTTTLPTKRLTAYHMDVKKHLRKGCTKQRNIIMKQLEETLSSKRISFSDLFPPKSFQKDVLSRILLLASVSGICVWERKELAKSVGCSVRLVDYVIDNIKVTGEFVVAGLADGNNKNIYILKSHPNFRQIIKDVFFMDDLPAEYGGEIVDIAERIAVPIAEREPSTNTVGTASNVAKMPPKSFKSFKPLISKHESSVIKQSVEDEVTSVINKAETIEQAEIYLTAYIDNPIQLQLFHNIHEYPFLEEIQKHSAVLVLRAGSRGTVTPKLAIKAIQVLNDIDRNIRAGVVIKSLTATFEHDLFTPKVYPVKKAVPESATVPKAKRVPFYNWLEIRD